MTLDIAKLRAETLALIDGTTPGPWISSDKGTPGYFWVEPEAGYLPPPHYLCIGGAVSEDNARLIAAAPTLAADTLRLLDDNLRLRSVLQDIVESWDWWTVDEYDRDRGGLADSIDAARAALAQGGPDDR